MAQLKDKIKAFTIMESMVSIVIVMVAFSLASIVIINATSSGFSKQKQHAYLLVRSLKTETIKENRYLDETIETDGIELKKTILDYHKGEKLKILLIEAFIEKRKLIENRSLVLTEIRE